MRNIAMILTYEGTAYHGWQVQKNAISVCETMERAASMVLGHKAKITGCGRTDAGVHARNYVANVHTENPGGSAALCHEYPFASRYRGA